MMGFNPKNITKQNQGIIAGLLLVLMAITRAEYLSYLQDASWAIFFIVGFYIRSYAGLALFLLLAIVIDFAQIAMRGGHQDFFLAPSYLFIIPAYSALWFAGRFFANKYSENIKGLIVFFVSAVIGIIACHLISSGGYYWMSLKIIDLNFEEFTLRTLEYLPLALMINLMYLTVVAILHLIFIRTNAFKF